MIPIRINELNDIVSSDYLRLNSCGVNKLSNVDTGSLRPNGRNDYHILYILSGKCYFECDDHFEIAESGDLLIYYPGQRQHYKYVKEDETVSCFLHFSGTGCESLLNDLGFTKDKHLYNLGFIPNVDKMIVKMRFEYTQKKRFFEHRTSAILLELLSIFGRRLAESSLYNDNSYVSRIDKVCKMMIEDFDCWHNMEYYAEQSFLSVSRFEHIFREITGVSPNKYLTALRINRATELLVETDLSVADISTMLGFSSLSYFIRVFRKHTGTTPLNYKNGSFSDD